MRSWNWRWRAAARRIPWIAAIKDKDEAKYKAICQTIREDGRFIEAGENDNLIVQKLKANPNAIGIFGYSFLEQNEDTVQGSTVDGQAPTFETISSGTYPVSRPLFFYVKKAHVRLDPGHPGIRGRVHEQQGHGRGRLSG